MHLDKKYLFKTISELKKLNKLKKSETTLKPKYIFYTPKKIKNNVIYLLLKDLAKHNKQTNFDIIFAENIFLLFLNIFKTTSRFLIFVPHQSLLRRLRFCLIPSKKIVCWFTHFDPRQNISFQILNGLKYILFIGVNEYNYYKCFSKSLNVERFQLGYDENIFFYSNEINFSDRKIDFLISCNYWKNPSYAKRKNYDLLIKVSNLLADLNYSICINGDGWMDCQSLNDKILVTNLSHKDTPKLFCNTKVFLMLSNIEGGHTSLIEALACGTKALCTPTGFALDFIDLNSKVQFINQHSDINEIVKKAESFLRNKELNAQASFKIKKKLSEFTFSALNRKLDKLINNMN